MKVQDKTAFDEQNIFGQGMANTAIAQYFIGNSYLNPLTKPGESIVGLSPLSRAAAITGTSIMRKLAADRSSSAPRAKVGIRRKGKMQ